MKMPSDSSNNPNEPGFYQFDEAPYFFEQVELSENSLPHHSADETNSTVAEADFSEYMWMEHMEEFDREVGLFLDLYETYVDHFLLYLINELLHVDATTTYNVP